jgi:outer membrane protein assembly factor BamB
MNGDGLDDVVQCPYTIYASQSGKTGKPLFPPTWIIGPKCFKTWLAYFSPTPVDLDGDGKLDVYLNSTASTSGGCAALHGDGAGMWIHKRPYTDGPPGLGPVGDFDGDGKVDIAIGMLTQHVLCLNGADGTRKWQVDTPVNGDIIAADINSDGIMELIFTGQDGLMRAISGKDGQLVWSIPCNGQPIAADVDGDGYLEIVAVDMTHGTLDVIR